MRQYLELKDQHPDAILFFRMGDFYELFLEDAEIAAPIMDVALTKRQNEIPMCGVPHHSTETYIARLLGRGKRVAVAEQEADPENPKLMRRVVRRVITQGTVVEDSLLDGAGHNFLMSVVPNEECDGAGIAVADVSTGDFFCFETQPSGTGEPRADFTQALRDAFSHYVPREILVPTDFLKFAQNVFSESPGACVPVEDWRASPTEGRRQIEQKFATKLKGLGFPEDAERSPLPSLGAVALVLHYVNRTFPNDDVQLSPPVFRSVRDRYMVLDEQSIRNLDLVSNAVEGGASRSLYGVLDQCRTPVGKRYLKQSLLAPLLDAEEIARRQDIVEVFAERLGLRENLTAGLGQVYDLERVLSRTAAGRGAPRDFAALTNTVRAAESLGGLLNAAAGEDAEQLRGLISVPGELMQLAVHFEEHIVDEPPAVLGNGPLIRAGVDEELDRAREAQERGSRWIADFEKEERDKTGITALRVKYNKIHGYFIEISKGQADQAPGDYVRRQTLVGYERFTSDRLEELQRTLLEADEVITRVEGRLFRDLGHLMLQHTDALRRLMRSIAHLDFLLSLARCAVSGNWVRPEMFALDEDGAAGELVIRDGRHPVVEKFLPTGDAFIPNDSIMDTTERRYAIITGPNMAGKSTYIRQLGLIQLLAQIGSFVPAAGAQLPIVDRIFTRIGASDNLTRGESTFFVEMLETARILNQCSPRSLVIMDEVGRGTSTYDGISLAWAITEFLSDDAGPRPLTVFATHYHELTVLAEREGVFNLTMDVQDTGDRVIFLHKVKEGAADRSYGIHVAKLAGLPESVLTRANEKLAELESDLDRNREETRKAATTARRRKMDEDAQGELFG